MVSRFRVSLYLRCWRRRRRRRRNLVSLFLSLPLLSLSLLHASSSSSPVWGIPEAQAVWVSALVVWAYTVSGGLFSVAYTDVVQGAMGWSGCVVMAFWYVRVHCISVYICLSYISACLYTSSNNTCTLRII
jgi:Na+/proline symporter